MALRSVNGSGRNRYIVEQNKLYNRFKLNCNAWNWKHASIEYK